MLQKRFTILCVVGVALLSLFAVGWSPYCYSRQGFLPPPVILAHEYASFQTLVASVIAREGGMPKSDLVLSQDGRPMSSVSMSPVERWEIEQIVVENRYGPLSGREPTYRVTMAVWVRYADGDEALLRWSTWGFGYHLGPLIVSQGIGPPWEIARVRASTD